MPRAFVVTLCGHDHSLPPDHMLSHLVSHRRLGILAVGLAFAGAGTLAAHDFWIVPTAFMVDEGGALELRGQTSTHFPSSVSAVVPERIADARLIAASSEERLTDFSVSGNSLMIRHRPAARGQRVVAVALVARSARTTPGELQRYIALEGAPELAARYEREGTYPKTDSVTRASAKFAKTVIEVGRAGPRAFSRVAGHPLEIVPLADPASLRSGDTLPVRVLYRGRPVQGAHVHAGAAHAAVTDPAPAAGSPESNTDISVETDANGVARVPLREGGIWNVRTLHGAPQPATAGTWEVLFATLVFNVTGPSAGGGDAAAVAAVIDRYHRALAAGDSATALALLAPDATILESGGKESRDDYRGHHLPGDIAFAQAVPSERTPPQVTLSGESAWAWSTSRTKGDFRGRAINSVGAELMVLGRQPDGRWLIRAIHWSSRNRPAGS